MTIELNEVRLYTDDDVYHYTVDNRPLQDLASNDEILAEAINNLDPSVAPAPASVADYPSLRAYAGQSTSINVTGYYATSAPIGIAGLFVRDDSDTSSVDNGGTIIVAANNKRWKRVFAGPANIQWFATLVGGTGASEDWATAIQTAVNNHKSVTFPYRTLGYRITVPVTLNSGQRLSGEGKIFRDDQTNHLLMITSCDDIIINGLSFSHNYTMVGDRGTSSAIYGLTSSRVKVTHCNFNNIGLFAVSTDQSGDGWVVTNCRFYDIAGSAYDARGGAGHLVTNNIIVNTGDDAIDVANSPGLGAKRTVIANNIITRPGQIKVGGGGIRVNAAGSLVSGNNIYGANMYFIVVAALTTDGTIKPDRVIIEGNLGYGIKPTTNNTTGCVLVKNANNVEMYNNNFDAVGDTAVTITNVANNGSTQCRFTAANHGYTTGNIVRVSGVVGVTGANGSGAVTVIDANTFDITTLAFSGAYTSGGIAINATYGIRAYSGDNTPTKNNLIVCRNNKFLNIEAVLRVQLLGLDKFWFTDNYVDTYIAPTAFSDTSTMSEFIMLRNTFKNGATSLFDGTGAGLVSITRMVMNDNDASSPAVLTNIPINFNSATVTNAEILRNKLGGAGDKVSAPNNIKQFTLASNVATMYFDGDYSGLRYNQGTGTIAQGATLSSAISHGCALVDGTAQQPKTLELSVNVALGALTAQLVQPTNIISSTFVVATNTAAPSGGLAFVWRLAPAVQRYVNGNLAT
jgi:hypothetical protein